MQKITAMMALGLLLVVNNVLCDTATSTLEGRYTKFERYHAENIATILEDGQVENTRLLNRFMELGFHEYLSTLHKLNDHDLGLLFRATVSVLFYYPRHPVYRDLEQIFELLVHRDDLSEQDVWRFYRAQVLAGRYQEARELRREFPDNGEWPLPPLPAIVDGDYDSEAGPGVLHVNSPDLPLTRSNIEFHRELAILVASSPTCGASQGMMEYFQGSDQWSSFFSEWAHWVVANPMELFRIEELHQWNESSPFEIVLLEDLADWPFITHLGTPRFYIIREDQPVEILGGNPESILNRLTEIVAEAEEISQRKR